MRNALFIVVAFFFPAVAYAADAQFFKELDRIRADVQTLSMDSLQAADRLIELTKDGDPAIRKAAVRALRSYLYSWQVRDRILEVLRDSREAVEVRGEAAKDLSSFLNDDSIADKLLEVAKNSREPLPLRVLSIKSLYHQAAFGYNAREYLVELAKRGEPELRVAAIWGLYLAAGSDYTTREVLLENMRRSYESPEVRLESLKSLSLALADWNVKDKIVEIAKSSTEAEPLQTGAIMALANLQSDPGVRDLLEELSKGSRPPAIRRAATLALGDPNNPEILNFFHRGTYSYADGRYTDPLDQE